MDRDRLLIRPEARAEVAEAAGWYEAREPGLGRDFLRAFRAATDRLRRDPFHYQIVFADMRRVLLRRFPYGVFYEIHGADVVVLGCMHTARDPELWQGRAPGG
ncbi:type II toxin-antitoxin system RelE/ParE family toxin [Longimicrobium sp.]|uniref:type II toxin-antitoxin system RelE/ParE family toxin n=1 Tax=Longimicrobium sp. TaxID=2029185 RepID=UPI002E334814|nr:type II toxin-antitoxin system RelE/ParE family toxin [Longimicrobium sp.]HEX6038062.1 type II toxin-antitoxin system RelE/ParE family toxin [Longimicrobium sp.]